MGDDAPFEFGTEDDPSLQSEELNLSGATEEYEFTLEQMSEASQLLDLPVGLRVMYVFKKMGGSAIVERPMSQWDGKELGLFGAVIASIGTKKMKKDPLGSLEYRYEKRLENASVEAIKASLLTDKAATLNIVTDASLVSLVAESKNTILGEDAALRYASLQYPGCPFKILVGASGWKRGRVIDHGGDFVNWYNKAYNENLVFREIQTEAVRMAAIFQLLYRVDSAKDDVIVITEQVHNWNGTMLGAFGKPSEHFRNVGKRIKTLMENAYRLPINRQPAGMGLKTPVFYEYIFDRIVTNMSQQGLTNLRDALDRISTAEKQKWDQFTTANGTLFGKAEEKDLGKQWKAFVNSECRPPGAETTIKTKGNALKYVEDSRNHIRDVHDLNRKSDSLTVGFVAGSLTSVPVKIGTAIKYLKSMAGMKDEDKFGEVDAWGVHVANYWHYAVKDNALVVHWRDKDRNSKIPLAPDEIIPSDVEAIIENSKSGMYCFDDTWNAKAEQVVMNPDAKIQAIAKSGYEGGFVKLYYGAGADAIIPVGGVSPHMETMLGRYEQVALAPGGSPHSPEYFLVFNRKRPPPGSDGRRVLDYHWVPPKRSGNESYPIPGNEFSPVVDGEPPDVHKPRIMSYFKTWGALFGFEMVRMNVCINYDIMNCCRNERVMVSTIKPVFLGVIKLAGSRPVSTRLREEDLVAPAPVDEGEFDF